ncbi:transcriptional regulator [Ophiocordyceps camponoti-floridani]|uniref:Transcriptional regulator n=1 Tax=Ophiocordyceps camponoti-floridani TaxID=2030778 RepID=A0A8H4VCU4_9HYPO|nr:transcriptional regulator [Ophiocordyceps camponoti-floridani]
MPPSAKVIETALIDGTCHVYEADPESISVNGVRRHVEQKLDLEQDFFTTGEWKNRSKALIKEYVDKLHDGWAPEPKGRLKRSSSEPQSPPVKRQKRVSHPKVTKRDKSRAGNAEGRPKEKKATARSKPRATASDDDEEEAVRSPPVNKKRKVKAKDESEDEAKGTTDQPDSHDEGELETPVKSHLERDGKKTSAQEKDDSDVDSKEPVEDCDVKAVVDEEEEYSDVIDEPPKPKARVKKNGKDASKTSKPAMKKVSVSTAEDGPEAEVKKLQSQLVKCGIRKLWHNELKKYGDDSRAKTRHLKKMLADIGMDGRFSEAKAREIKETRELMAEAEAAQQMNQLWGSNSNGRASRSKSKTTKAEESEMAEGGSEDGEEAESNSFAARRRRAQADLAFLGDDSDSD